MFDQRVSGNWSWHSLSTLSASPSFPNWSGECWCCDCKQIKHFNAAHIFIGSNLLAEKSFLLLVWVLGQHDPHDIVWGWDFRWKQFSLTYVVSCANMELIYISLHCKSVNLCTMELYKINVYFVCKECWGGWRPLRFQGLWNRHICIKLMWFHSSSMTCVPALQGQFNQLK